MVSLKAKSRKPASTDPTHVSRPSLIVHPASNSTSSGPSSSSVASTASKIRHRISQTLPRLKTSPVQSPKNSDSHARHASSTHRGPPGPEDAKSAEDAAARKVSTPNRRSFRDRRRSSPLFFAAFGGLSVSTHDLSAVPVPVPSAAGTSSTANANLSPQTSPRHVSSHTYSHFPSMSLLRPSKSGSIDQGAGS